MAATTNINGWNVGGNNNSFDQRGHFYRAFLTGNVSGMVVKQNSTPNMTVLVEHGSALLNKNTISASVAEIKADTSVAIDTADTANPRIDTVVIYEDTSVAIPTVEANYWQDGAGGRFKIVSIPGAAAASPVALNDASIQSAIGASKPWARLADITVPANTTTIINSNIADKRVKLAGVIQDASITAASISNSAIYLGHKTQTTDHNTGATTSRVDISGFNVLVTVPTTTRKIKITLSVSDVLNASGSGTDAYIGFRDGSTVLIERQMGVGNGSRVTVPSLVWVGDLTPGNHTIQVYTRNAIATNVLYGFDAPKIGMLLVEMV